MKIKKLGLIKNKKAIILGTMAMIMSLSLTACGTKVATDTNDEEVSQSEETEIIENEVEENELNEDKTTESNTSTESNNNSVNNNVNQDKQENSTETNTNTNTNENTDSLNQNLNGLTSLTYTSDNLGITFNVPDSWKGKYDVIEEDGKVSVYMKHKDNNMGIGLLFIIKKQGIDEYEVLNSIDGKDSVDVNGETLIVGGPTGYCMEDGDSLIPTYNQMVGECVYPVNSIKAK